MAMPSSFVGPWEEVKKHDAELRGRQVRLFVIGGDAVGDRPSQSERLRRAEAMIRELGKGLAPFPNRTLTLDDYYPDEE